MENGEAKAGEEVLRRDGQKGEIITARRRAESQ